MPDGFDGIVMNVGQIPGDLFIDFDRAVMRFLKNFTQRLSLRRRKVKLFLQLANAMGSVDGTVVAVRLLAAAVGLPSRPADGAQPIHYRQKQESLYFCSHVS